MSKISIVDELNFFLDYFPLRDIKILDGRFFSEPKETLDYIGLQYGLTRERIRQVEKQTLSKIHDWLQLPEIQSKANSYRNKEVQLLRLEDFLNLHPELASNIDVLNQPAWKALSKLSDTFEVSEDWVYFPSKKRVSSDFSSFFETVSEGNCLVDISVLESHPTTWLDMSIVDLIDWSTSNGFQKVNEYLALPNIRSINEWAFCILTLKNMAMKLSDIHRYIPNKSSRSVGNAMMADQRFKRVGKDSWELAVWGGESYEGLRNEIIQILSEKGSVELEELTQVLPQKFGVSENSVRIYADTWPLETFGKTVRFSEAKKITKKPLYKSKNTYFSDNSMIIRVLVNSEHLRGSGFNISAPAAQNLGLEQGSEISFLVENYPKNDFYIRWNGPQPTCSSIKNALNDFELEEGDYFFIIFADQKVTFQFIKSQQSNVESRIKNILLLPQETLINRKIISLRLGLPHTSLWHEIIETAEARKEADLLEALNAYLQSQTS